MVLFQTLLGLVLHASHGFAKVWPVVYRVSTLQYDSNDESTHLPDELVLRSDETSSFVRRYLL